VTRDLFAWALARVPDVPRWIDTRGMLLSGAADVRFAAGANPARDGFVVLFSPRALMAVVGRPPADLIVSAAGDLPGSVNVLCPMDRIRHVAACLPGWQTQTAVIHSWAGLLARDARDEDATTIFRGTNAPDLSHVPEALRAELRAALSGRPSVRFSGGQIPAGEAGPLAPDLEMSAAWADGLPVSFCYPVVQTETLWDVSIDTLEAYRGRGLGGVAARPMIRRMLQRGKQPVWGALESNLPSRRLAARLGFVEADRISVLTRERT
jgi:RimJ/RimL family protein N-acetyltransferase